MQRGDLIPRQAAPWASCSRGLASSDRAPAMACQFSGITGSRLPPQASRTRDPDRDEPARPGVFPPHGQDEESTQGGRHAIPMTALPRQPRSRPGRPVRYLSSTAGAGTPEPARQGETARLAAVGAGVQPAQAAPFRHPTHRPPHPPRPTSGWTITRVTCAHPDPPCGAGTNGESAAAQTVMTRGDRSRQDECRPLTAAHLQRLGHRTQPARATMPTAAARIPA